MGPPDSKLVKIESKQAWISDGSRVRKLNRAHVLPQPDDQDRRRIGKLLKTSATPQLPTSSDRINN